LGFIQRGRRFEILKKQLRISFREEREAELSLRVRMFGITKQLVLAPEENAELWLLSSLRTDSTNGAASNSIRAAPTDTSAQRGALNAPQLSH